MRPPAILFCPDVQTDANDPFLRQSHSPWARQVGRASERERGRAAEWSGHRILIGDATHATRITYE